MNHIFPAASGAARHILQELSIDCKKPVIAHWPTHEFPKDLALGLLRDGFSPFWAVGSKERQDHVLSVLTHAGIPCRAVHSKNAKLAKASGIPTLYDRQRNVFKRPTINVHRRREQLNTLDGLQKIRHGVRLHAYDESELQEKLGVVTVILAASLNAVNVRNAVKSWTKSIVVLDHLTDLHCRWKDATDEDDDEAERGFYIRPSEEHIPSRIADMDTASVYCLRDEWAAVLLSTYFNGNKQAFVQVAVEYKIDKNIQVAAWTSHFATSKYDGPAFLALATPPKTNKLFEAQLIANGLLGCISPARLSMAGAPALTKAILKFSSPSLKEIANAASQCPERANEFIGIRLRDQLRTALLSFDPTGSGNELIVLASPKLIGYLHRLLPSVPVANIAVDPYKRVQALKMATPFQVGAAAALTTLPKCLLSKSAKGRVLALATREFAKDEKSFLKRVVRIATGLAEVAGASNHFNWLARPEATQTISPQVAEVIRLVDLMIQEVLPWSPEKEDLDTLKVRGTFYQMCNERMDISNHLCPSQGVSP